MEINSALSSSDIMTADMDWEIFFAVWHVCRVGNSKNYYDANLCLRDSDPVIYLRGHIEIGALFVSDYSFNQCSNIFFCIWKYFVRYRFHLSTSMFSIVKSGVPSGFGTSLNKSCMEMWELSVIYHDNVECDNWIEPWQLDLTPRDLTVCQG